MWKGEAFCVIFSHNCYKCEIYVICGVFKLFFGCFLGIKDVFVLNNSKLSKSEGFLQAPSAGAKIYVRLDVFQL